MKLLHRQILKELLFLYALSTACLLGLIIIGRMLQLRELFLTQSMGVLDMFLLFFYLSPFFMLLITPISSMLAVFLTFLRMSTDNELVAIKSGGVSLYQMLPAPLMFCVLSMAFSMAMAFWGLSWGMDQFKDTIFEYARTRSKLAMQAGVFNSDIPGLTFYAQQVDNENGILKFVFARDESLEDTSVVVVAPEGRIITDPSRGEIRIQFGNGRIFRQNGDALDVLKFGTYTVKLPLGQLLGDFRLDRNKPSEMSFFRLWELAHNPELTKGFSPRDVRKIPVEMMKRITLPTGCLILGLFALPMACIFRGLKQQYGLMLSMGLFIVYYTMFSVGVSLGEAGSLNPWVGLWTPNVIFLMVALLALRYANAERIPTVVQWIMHLRDKRGEA